MSVYMNQFPFKFWRILSILALLMSLTGCASIGLSSEASHIVVLWHTFTGTEADALQILTDMFNRENRQNIVLITEYQRDIAEKLASTTVEHRPDLVIVWPEDVPGYMQQGLGIGSADFPQHFPQEYADILPMAAALYTLNGEMQAFPLGLATYILYYNVSWMGDLGYNTEYAGWEDLRRAACAATDPLVGHMGIGVPAQASTLLALLTAGGATLVDESGQYQFADAEGIDMAVALNEVLGGICGFVYNDMETGLTWLSNSSLSMIVESSLSLPEINQAVIDGRNFAVGLAPIPGKSGPGPTLWYGPGMMLLASDEVRQAAAINVLLWFYTSEAQEQWSTMTNYLPVRRSLVEARISTAQDMSVASQLSEIALSAATNGTWVVWPPHTHKMACRASLLRALLSFGGKPMPGAYIDAAVTACNIGIRSVP